VFFCFFCEDGWDDGAGSAVSGTRLSGCQQDGCSQARARALGLELVRRTRVCTEAIWVASGEGERKRPRRFFI